MRLRYRRRLAAKPTGRHARLYHARRFQLKQGLCHHGFFIGQMEQALLNIKAVVETAGGTVQDIVRLTWYVTDKKEYLARQREVGEAYRRIFGRNFPAMTMVVVSGLIEDQALVEIEATAVLAREKTA